MSRRTVLVADDDPLTREVLSRTLELRGVVVELAEDGEDALDRVRELRPDAAVLGQGLPGRSGLEVLAAMRDDEALAGVPVVLLDHADDGDLPADPVAAGALAHLETPCSPLHLVEVLGELLR